jgi:hypothetical protein
MIFLLDDCFGGLSKMSSMRRQEAVLAYVWFLIVLPLALALGTISAVRAQDTSSAVSSAEISSSAVLGAEDTATSAFSSSAEETQTETGDWNLALPIFLLSGGGVIGALVMFFLVMGRARSASAAVDGDEASVFAATQTIALTTSVFAVVGVVIMLWMSIGLVSGSPGFYSVFGGSLIAGAAAAALGSVAGFIFGIPRTREAADQLSAVDGAARPEKSRAALLANTNLERISDWLTTLLIGATLVQLQNIPSWLEDIARVFADGPTVEDLIPFVLVYFFGLAFLGIYLITRLYLTAALRRALGLLDGSDMGRATDTSGAKAQLDAAYKSRDHAKMLEAVLYFDRSGIKSDQAGDPELSLLLARVLTSLLKAGKADDAPPRKEQLKTVVAAAAKTNASKEQLKAVVNAGETTGDAELDKEILALIGG